MLVVEHSSRRIPAAIAEARSGRGQSLGSLSASCLLDRFYSWRGASQERYVCSIFSPEEERIIAGFSNAAVIGVVREAGRRRPLCVVSSREFGRDAGRLIRSQARACGVNEWHVHFGSGDAGLRDLADSLLH